MGTTLIEPKGTIDALHKRAGKEAARVCSIQDVRELHEYVLVRAAKQRPTSSHDLP
jgi:hypothetical protein